MGPSHVNAVNMIGQGTHLPGERDEVGAVKTLETHLPNEREVRLIQTDVAAMQLQDRFETVHAEGRAAFSLGDVIGMRVGDEVRAGKIGDSRYRDLAYLLQFQVSVGLDFLIFEIEIEASAVGVKADVAVANFRHQLHQRPIIRFPIHHVGAARNQA